MEKLSILLLFFCLNFRYSTAQQVDSSKVDLVKQDTTQQVLVPPPPPKEEIIFRKVEDLPCFPGCEVEDSRTKMKKCSKDKIQEFIQERIKYPIEAKENGVEGICLVSFRVKRNGKIHEVKLVEDIGGQCGQEALRIINLMIAETPYWIPPVNARRRIIDVKYIVPIHFKLNYQSNSLLGKRRKKAN